MCAFLIFRITNEISFNRSLIKIFHVMMKTTKFFITLLTCVAVMFLVDSCKKKESDDPVFAVSVSNDGHGTAVATVDDANVTRAKKGAMVMLIATPDAGYTFKR